MTIRIRLFGAFLGLGALSCVVGGLALLTNNEIDESIPQVTESSLPEFNLAYELEVALLGLQMSIEHEAWAAPNVDPVKSGALQKALVESVQNKLNELQAETELSVHLASANGEEDEAAEEKEELEELDEIQEEFVLLRENLARHLRLLATQDRAAALSLKRDVIVPQLEQRLITPVRELRKDSHQEVVGEADEIAKAVEVGSQFVQIGTLVTVFAGLLLSWWTARSIVRPVRVLELSARKVQAGNFTSRVPCDSMDELGVLGRAFNDMMDRLAASAVLESESREAIRSSEENLTVTLQSIGDAVLATDAAGRVTRLNPVGETLTGWKAAEAVGHPVGVVFRIVQEQTRKPAVIPVADTLMNGTIRALTNHTVLIARDGTERPIAESCAPIRDRDGRVIGTVLVFRDVTEECAAKRALLTSEAELRQLNETLERRVAARTAALSASEERFAYALDATSEGLWDWNLETGAVYYSPQWIRLVGHVPEEVAPTLEFFKSILHPEDVARTLHMLDEHMSGRTPVKELEVRLRRQSGDYCWFLDRSKVVVRDTDGAPLRIVGTITDITSRKAAEAELDQAHTRLLEVSRLAGMAEVATGVLHNVGNVLNSVNVSATIVVEQIRKSKATSLAKAVQLLQEHQQDLGEFLTTHPKGKQLTPFLVAVSEQLTREQVTLVKEMQAVQQHIEHIKQVVSRQQSYAKVSGVLEQVTLAELMEDALRMASTSFARHHIEVLRQFDSVPPVLVDRHLTLQILVNLISNARQALEQRSEGRRLVLRIAQSERERVRVEVTDNGMGIPPENLARIFNHGFTTKKTGHGFGLHSSANAAKEMNGSLAVRSDGPGTGATFILELPVSSDATPPLRGAV